MIREEDVGARKRRIETSLDSTNDILEETDGVLPNSPDYLVLGNWEFRI